VDHTPPREPYASTVVENTVRYCGETQPGAVRATEPEMDQVLHKQAEAVRQNPCSRRNSIAARCGPKDLPMRQPPLGPVHPSHILHLGLMSMVFDVPFDRAIIAYKHAESILRSNSAPYTHRVLDLVGMDSSKHTILPSQMIRTIKELTAWTFNGARLSNEMIL